MNNRPFLSSATTSLVGAAVIALACIPLTSADSQILKNRPFMKSIGGKLSAQFDGARCGNTVKFVFKGQSAGSFNADRVASRLMNNVVTAIRQTCPRVKLVSAKGLVGKSIVYNALAESQTNWLLLELGSSRDASLLSSGVSGKAGDKSKFQRRASFKAFSDVAKSLGTTKSLCTEPVKGRCTSLTNFSNVSTKGATITSKSRLDDKGSTAVLTYAGKNQNGFLCSNPQNVKISIVGGSASKAARSNMAEQLRERLRPFGNQACQGYATGKRRLAGANFDAKGAQVGKTSYFSTVSRNAGLRRAN
ncbi:hypothetical protein [Parasphingorhabdus flavimaris]|uniref:hypothetical protein n=1 Tax=Parasphingorhabdus flavimaris TaxID=266812 RepID=UPI003001B10E